MDILETIIGNKRLEVSRQKQAVDLEMLLNAPYMEKPLRSMKKALINSNTGIISEFKRRSPSKGWISENASVEDVTTGYEKNGASALSVLTDEKFFGGSLSDFCKARARVELPILRKEFIIDEYQIYQSRAVGADAVLLIASALTLQQCCAFSQLAQNLGMEVLLEIHDEKELEYIAAEPDMIGINNRNLGTFATSTGNSFRLIEKLPDDAVCISESGISDPETVLRLREAGFKGFLMGENFMKTKVPGQTLGKFINRLESKSC